MGPGEGVGVGVDVGIGVGVCVDVGIGVVVAVGVGVWVPVGVGVGVIVEVVTPSHPASRATIHQKARPFILQLRDLLWAQQSSEPQDCERGDVGCAVVHSSAQFPPL